MEQLHIGLFFWIEREDSMEKDYDFTGLQKFVDQHHKEWPVVSGLEGGDKMKNFLPYTGRK